LVTLSKLLDLALAPLSWSLALLLAAAWLRRRRRLAWALGAVAVGLLTVFSTAPIANALYRFAERSAVPSARPGVVYDAVIILAGGMDISAARATGELELDAAAERIVRGWEVMNAGQARSALISGGLVYPEPGDPGEAGRVARKLVEWGVAPERVVAETRSRNTHENAVETARIVRERGWRTLLLVTSAAHMGRALGCFRREGLSPDALPVDHRAGAGGSGAVEWLPRAKALDASTEALRELGGRVVYWVLGYTAPSITAPARS